MEIRETQSQSKPTSEAMDRLRDRTDELVLIISSLTTFASFSLPGWLFDKFADVYWNPDATDMTAPLDDRYTRVNGRNVLPIAFAPGYELSVDRPTATKRH